MTLEEYVKSNSITYTKLSKQLGVSVSYVSKLHRNQIYPNNDIKNKLEALGIDVNALTIEEIKSSKDDMIDKLKERIKHLNIENSILRTQIQLSIDKALNKLVSKKVYRDLRLINLHDCDTDFLVQTNAPKIEIVLALEHVQRMLINDDPNFRSDFEEAQSYLHSHGYVFEQVNYITEIERYNW